MSDSHPYKAAPAVDYDYLDDDVPEVQYSGAAQDDKKSWWQRLFGRRSRQAGGRSHGGSEARSDAAEWHRGWGDGGGA